MYDLTPKQYSLTPEEQDAIKEYLEKKGLPRQVGVTFNDVREIPPKEWEELDAVLSDEYTEVGSRGDIVDFRAVLAGNIVLNIPLTAANMEAVTGDELAVALAREGGMAFLPQMLDLKDRLKMIERIRRTDSTRIKHPLSIGPDASLKDAKELMNKYQIFSLVVVDERRPIGILSKRDWKYENDESKTVAELMTRKGQLIIAYEGISFEEAQGLLYRNKIEKLPLVNVDGFLAGLITAHGLLYTKHYPRALRDEAGQFLVSASVGVGERFTDDHLREVEAQLELGACTIMIDTARAFAKNVATALETFQKRYPNIPRIAGNTCSPKGTKFLFEHGADAVKINQGRGSVCTTSWETPIGVAQLTAIGKASVIARRYGKHIIADGGMKGAQDFVKAIVAGADTLMSGALFAGTHESAAEAHMGKGRLDGSSEEFPIPVKEYFGSASFQSQRLRKQRKNLKGNRKPEGKAKLVPVTGSVEDRVEDVLGSFRSAMSYVGATTLDELRERAIFELQTRAARFEGTKQ